MLPGMLTEPSEAPEEAVIEESLIEESLIEEALIELDLDADLDAVWNAITTDQGLAEWIGEGSTIGSSPGDELRFRDSVSGENKRGFLDEVTPHRRLGYTWWPEADPQRSTRVAISLEPSHLGTRVTVVESRPRMLTPPTATASASSVGSALAGTQLMMADWMWRQAMLAVSMQAVPVVAANAGR